MGHTLSIWDIHYCHHWPMILRTTRASKKIHILGGGQHLSPFGSCPESRCRESSDFVPPNTPAMSTRCEHTSPSFVCNVYYVYWLYIRCQSCQPANMICRRLLNFWYLIRQIFVACTKPVFGRIPPNLDGVWFVDPPRWQLNIIIHERNL